MEQSFKRRIIYGLLWGGLNNGGQQLLNLVFGIFLARMLTPTDYGMIGMLSIFTVIATALQESGFTTALVNRPATIHKDYNAVFWFSIGMSITLYILLFACSPLIATFYHKPELTQLARYSFLGFVLSGIGTAHSAWLFKHLMVKQRAISQLTALIISGCTGIVLAYNNCSYWGIATQNLIYVAITTICYWHFAPWKPTFNIDMRPLREMLGFSCQILATNILSHINYNLFSSILGRNHTTRDVGFYDQAYKWSSMGGLFILGMINSVAQPALSRTTHNQELQQRVFRKLMFFTIVISFSLMFCIGIMAKKIVIFFLTEKWADTIPLLELLCISGAFVPITNLYQQLLISRGQSRLYMWGVISEGALICIGLLWASPYGISTMLKVYVCLYICYVIVWHYLSQRS